MPPSGKYRTRAELLVHTAIIVAVACAVFTLMVGAVMSAWRMYGRLQVATEGADQAKTQVALLQTQEAKTKDDLAHLTSDRGIEAALRDRYNVVQPGEGVIQVVESALANAGAGNSSSVGFLGSILHTLWPF